MIGSVRKYLVDKELRHWTLLLQDIALLLTNPDSLTLSIPTTSDRQKEGEEGEAKQEMAMTSTKRVTFGDPLIEEIGDEQSLWEEAVVLLKERCLLSEFITAFAGTSRALAMYRVVGEYLLDRGDYRASLHFLLSCDPRPTEMVLQCCLRGGFADEYLSEV